MTAAGVASPGVEQETDLPPADLLASAPPGVALDSSAPETTAILWRGEHDGPMPVRGQLFGPGLPDLAKIAEEQWYEVLVPLDEQQRTRAACCPGLGKRALDAVELAGSMPPPASTAAHAALDGAPSIPVPTTGSPNAGRQLNIRMPRAAYADLQTAATLLGATPAQVARMLVLNGVRRVLAEHDVAIDRARRGGARA